MTIVQSAGVTLHGGEHTHPVTAHSLLDELQEHDYDAIAVEQPPDNLRLYDEESLNRYNGLDVRVAYTHAELHDLPLAAIDEHDTLDKDAVSRGDLLMNAALLSAASIEPDELQTSDAVTQELLSLPLSDLRKARQLYRDDEPELFDAVIDSRDQSMAAHLRALRQDGYENILAVVGQAHLPGIYDYLQAESQTADPMVLRP